MIREPGIVEPDWTVFEEVAPRSPKIRCRSCGATGYPNQWWLGGPMPGWWTEAHVRHPWSCSGCEMAFTTPQGLSAHRRAKHS